MHKRALNHLKKDQKLAPYLRNELAVNVPDGDVYAGLIQSIVSQQLSVKAAATIYGRFLDLFENQYPDPYKLLSYEDTNLRSVGLSGQKTKYVKNVAIYFDENSLYESDWSTVGNQEIIKKLTEIKGVGRWTVQMILMFTLGREDILPTGDLGIQQAMIDIYDIDANKKELPKRMEEIAIAWVPYRTIASRYLWAYKDNPPL